MTLATGLQNCGGCFACARGGNLGAGKTYVCDACRDLPLTLGELDSLISC